MIVHFTTSKSTLYKDISTLRKIVKTIKQDNHVLARSWIEDAYEKIRQAGKAYDVSRAYHHSMEEVAKADVMIAEVTRSSFGVGYQVANAIQQKKPVLLLTKEGVQNVSIVKALDDAVVSFREYDDNNLENIVSSFLADNDIQAKDLRFNFFIDRQIYSYLRWASYKTGKTKAKIVRELLLKEINKINE